MPRKKKKHLPAYQRWVEVISSFEAAKAKNRGQLWGLTKRLDKQETRIRAELKQQLERIFRTSYRGVTARFGSNELWIRCAPHNMDPVFKANEVHRATGFRTVHFVVTHNFREVARESDE